MPKPKVFRIETQDQLGNRAFVTRYENGRVQCVLANGIAASLHYAGIPSGREAETEWALRNAKNGEEALATFKAVQYRSYLTKLVT